MPSRIATPAALLAAALALAACGGRRRRVERVDAGPARIRLPVARRPHARAGRIGGDRRGPRRLARQRRSSAPADNRYTFGVFDPGGEPIADAEVALYVAEGTKGEAHGPYPAAIESLVPDGSFISRTTSLDPDVPPTFYVSDVEFPGDGEYRVMAMVKDGADYSASLIQSALVGKYDEIPQPGDEAPVVHTPTVDDVADLSDIDTRDPHDSMHDDRPRRRARQGAGRARHGDPGAVPEPRLRPQRRHRRAGQGRARRRCRLHPQEIYEDNVVDKGLRPQVEAYGLQTEPWIFVIDGDGKVQSSLRGPDKRRRARGRRRRSLRLSPGP